MSHTKTDQGKSRRIRVLRRLRWFGQHENILMSLLAVVVGLVSGLVAVLFRQLIALMQNLFLFRQLSLGDYLSPLDHVWGGWIILIPALGGLLVGLLTYFFAPETKGHGVPEVLEAAAVKGGRMRGRVVPVKAVATAVCLGSGGSTGREGPVVQICAAAGSYMAQIFHMRSELTKILLACGATGGIAASFNTPIAGVLFALELVALEFKTRSFIPLVIAAVFATLVSRTFLGDMPGFIVPEYTLISHYELLIYLLLGILAGLVAILFIDTSYRVEAFFNGLNMPSYLKPVLGGVLVGLLALFLPEILGGGYDTVSDVLLGKLGFGLCLLLVFGKILAVSLTLGSGGSGGVFAPSLFIGAMLGGAIGALFHHYFPENTASAGAYALVGMAAVFAGVSRATLTAIIILFEMTLNYNIILPLMFACVISDGVAWSLYGDSIYTKKLRLKGIRFFQDLGPDVLAMHLVQEVMSRNVETVSATSSLRSVWEKILKTGHQGFPLLGEDGTLVGIITASDVRRALAANDLDQQAEDYATKKLVTTYPDEDLHTLSDKIAKHKLGHIPVVDRNNSQILLGIITRSDLMKIGYGAL